MQSLNVIVTGVGGQGILTLARIIGEAAAASGLGALVAETHGLSQRGGSVVVHVRLGEAEAPLVPEGEGDLMISMELLEALRYSSYMRRGGEVVTDKLIIKPYGSRPPSAEEIVAELRSMGLNVYAVEAASIAEALGDVRAANVVLLGYAIARTQLGKLLKAESVEALLRRGKGAETNVKAFKLGMSAGKER
ncbi:MAG: indolepyruvate oxidoreductase subunit beta [Acidilobaceae archaeon]|nr:indolepyruvate oxidoreductase subunit beta [Acidilobaceae archaeon]